MRAAKWPEVTLGDICEFRYGKSLKAGARSGSGDPVFGSNGVVGYHSESLTKGPAIIIGRKGSFGEVHESAGPCWPIDTTYFIDETATDADLGWLAFRLRCLGLSRLNRAAAVPGLNRKDAYRLRILLPPIDEQRRIARVLGAADALRAKRREASALLESLSQAIYSATFEQHAEAEDFVTATLGDLCNVASGITKGRRTRATNLTEVAYLAVSNVQANRLDLESIKTIEVTEQEISRYRLEPLDLLLTEGGDPDKLGRGALWSGELEPCLHQNHVFRVRVRDLTQLHPRFLQAQVASARGHRYFLRSAKQTTGIASINKTQLSALPIFLPSFDEQERFVSALDSVRSALDNAILHLTRLDELFASLQIRAFAGDL